MAANRRHEEMKRMLAESVGIVSSLEGILQELGEAAELISTCLRSGGCLIMFGNGGSAAQAQHIAAELVGRFQNERHPLPAIALTTDSSVLTSLSNDYGFEHVFARQLCAIGKPSDIALAISTSGNSQNVLRALDAAREKKMRTIGLTGRKGGKMAGQVDLCLRVPSDFTPQIQEAHLVIAHMLCLSVETSLLSGGTRE